MLSDQILSRKLEERNAHTNNNTNKTIAVDNVCKFMSMHFKYYFFSFFFVIVDAAADALFFLPSSLLLL